MMVKKNEEVELRNLPADPWIEDPNFGISS